MIRRLFYMAVGACLAVWSMRKLQSLRPDHVARRAVDRTVRFADRLRDFADEVRHHSAIRESELRTGFGLDKVDATGASRDDDVKDGR
ncbi:hypothetical protein TBS_10590 [Thermobispora bispora]|uniref:Secreted protein n=1 Tax=Thermobispora bispora (strain ATCC 19993 / DSM 43833 / CBS 139.67 / JCM 10125 / KCTC 9307 / NBRC 14880 / R51) TaxID=469371 RepID=D6Y2B1_THEBD|nr:hypothetical protein [Thermobispora bispora]MBO2473343.1 hypothetical protein [Actinomycetales bacterium]MDI9580932.1 hypothetical protein [Thermobispora sp.]ADG88760.1 hypothetical protein Tbis_2048 [Thermobispora bispora DSM 43833]MBX6166177.1 hypothetical protein [Thermobispora bispora]QSI48529.1 hypothetical protein CYL17_12205 [Thermobispora bispora]